MRIFEKYAVKIGGGHNHRYNLSDAVMLKDNHIAAAGSITNAVKMAKDYASFVRKIEVEVETLEQVKEAVDAGADIIMLDNMSVEDMKKAIEIIDGRAETECSGNVTKENIEKLTGLGVDYISSAGLRVLLMAKKKLGSGVEVSVINANDVVKEIFDISGFSKILQVQ